MYIHIVSAAAPSGKSASQRRSFMALLASDVGVLILIALSRFLLHMLLNNRYGYHRDELAVIDYARTLAWGYVEFPPFTPFMVRIAMELFGSSPVAVCAFGALAQSLVVLMAGLMARDMGGKRSAQVLAALAAWIAAFSLVAGSLTLYATFDTFWWVATAWAIVRLQKSENPRWWLAIGACLSMGAMTKYTIGILIAGVIVGVLLTPMRRWLRSPWLWAGAALALVIVLPNLVWQVQHDLIAVEFTRAIHARDVNWGRTEGFLTDQLYANANPLTLPLWVAGLIWLFAAQKARHFRILGWMYAVPFVLFYALQGRGYYMAATYVWLLSAGAVAWEGWVEALARGWQRVVRTVTWGLVAVGGVFAVMVATPIAPINSPVWKLSSSIHDIFREELLWPELVQATATIYDDLPAAEKVATGIVAFNYGEAGAIDLLGPAYGLPPVISGTNSYWYRGFSETPPQQVIVLGSRPEVSSRWFTGCTFAGRMANPYGVDNEEAGYPGIYLCRGLRWSWAEMWPKFRNFG